MITGLKVEERLRNFSCEYLHQTATKRVLSALARSLEAYRYRAVLALSLVVGCVPTATTGPRERTQCSGLPTSVTVASVWGGTRVGFASQETRDFIYVGYYDTERWLTVSQLSKCNGGLRKVRLPSRFEGWDSHNAIAFALDAEGRLHVSGNMHAEPLVYARMSRPDDLSSLVSTQSMTGRDEERVTYPNFFIFPDGALGFSYRSGQSGNGKELVNRFEGGRWHRWTDNPIFAASDNSSLQVNAYHTGFVRGPDGFFHVAWVWRRDQRVETNFHVNYAKSSDLKTWLDHKGGPMKLPLTPSNADVVDPIPVQNGLLNNVKLGFDAAGSPVISYLKFDSAGWSQLFHARPRNGQWETKHSTTWKYRWDPRGGGTILTEISFSGVMPRGGKLYEGVRHPHMGSVTLQYDPDSLETIEVLRSTSAGPGVQVRREAIQDSVVNVLPVRRRNGDISQKHAISWLSRPADNRDKPRDCSRPGLPCNFVSELVLHTSPPQSQR